MDRCTIGKMETACYTGWRPRSMRFGRHRHEPDRKAKRERLGKSADRALYKADFRALKKHATRYLQLCRLVDSIHKIVRSTE